MPTMTHTKAERIAWHAGKPKTNETRLSWFRRVIIKDMNFRGAHTPKIMQRGISYHPLKK